MKTSADLFARRANIEAIETQLDMAQSALKRAITGENGSDATRPTDTLGVNIQAAGIIADRALKVAALAQKLYDARKV